VFAQSGIDATLVKFLSEAIKSKDSKKERAYFKYILNIKIVALVSISALLVLFSYPLANYFFNRPQIFIPLLAVTSYLFLLSLNEFFTSFFFAVRDVKNKTFKEVVYQISRIITLILMFTIIYNNPSILSALSALIVASFLTMIFILYRMQKIFPNLFTKATKLPHEIKRKILNFSFFVSMTSISSVFLGNIDTIMLGRIMPQTEFIGFYTAAFVMVVSISGLLSFGQVLLPFFIQVKSENLERVFNKSLRYSMIIAIPAAFGLAILGNYFILFIYGRDYLGATLSLYFLSFMLILSIYIGLSTELFSAKNRPKDYLLLLVLVILLDIVLNYLLINVFASYDPLLSITGAAIATLVSLSMYTIGLGILVKKKLKIKTKLSPLIKPLFSATIMVFVLYFLKIAFGDINIINGILLVGSGITTYFLTLFLIKGIYKEDYTLSMKIYKNLRIKFKL